MNAKKIANMAMLAALSIVLVMVVRFPIFPAAAFLEYDPADIPILIGTFAFGPVAGVALTIIVSVLQGFSVSASSGVYGILMHVIATGTFVITAGLIYNAKRSKAGAAIALLSGTAAMAVVMGFANLWITPIFMGVPVSVVKGMLFTYIIPFNLIKAGINSVMTFIVYKVFSKHIFRLNRKNG